MKNAFVTVSLCLGLAMPTLAQEHKYEIGVGINTALYQISEPEFSLDSEPTFGYSFELRYNLGLNNGFSLAYVKLSDIEVGANETRANDVGGKYSTTQIQLDYYHRVVFNRLIQPIIFGGILVNDQETTGKFSTDADGFLDETFPDRSSSETSIVIGARYKFEPSSTFTIQPYIQYEAATGDSADGAKLGVSFLKGF